jgi:hypothetical protein
MHKYEIWSFRVIVFFGSLHYVDLWVGIDISEECDISVFIPWRWSQ